MPAVGRFVKQFPVLTFFLAVYAISWGAWIPMALLGINASTQTGWLVYLFGSFGPSLAGLLLTGILVGPAGAWQLLRRLWPGSLQIVWLVTALGMPFVIMGAALAVQVILGGPAPQLNQPLSLGGILLWTYLRTAVTGGPLGEELGWRGFALPRMQARQSAVGASLLLGLVWGAWHAPIYFIPGTGQYEMAVQGQFLYSFLFFLVWVLALSILLTWIYNNTRGNLLAVLLFHAGVNTAGFLPAILNAPGGAIMLSGLFTWFAALLVLSWGGGKKLSNQPEEDAVVRETAPG